MPVPPPPLELPVPLEPAPDDPPPLVEPLLVEPLLLELAPIDPPLLVEPPLEEPLLVEVPPLPELGPPLDPPLDPEEFPVVPEEPPLEDRFQLPLLEVPHPPPAHRPASSKQPNAAASLARRLERRPALGRVLFTCLFIVSPAPVVATRFTYALMRGGPKMAHGEWCAGVLGESR
jgi:hypothetical protein